MSNITRRHFIQLGASALVALKLLPKQWISVQPQMGGYVTSVPNYELGPPPVPKISYMPHPIVIVIDGHGDTYKSHNFYDGKFVTWTHIRESIQWKKIINQSSS